MRSIMAVVLLLTPCHWIPAKEAQVVTVSGVVVARDGNGFSVRDAAGKETAIEWSDATQVALVVNTRQLGQLHDRRPEAEVARDALSDLEQELLDQKAQVQAAAGEAIENFLSAPDMGSRLKFCRHPQRVAPLMRDYYSRDGSEPGPVPFRKPREGWEMRPFETFLLAAIELEDFTSRPVAVERSGDGRYLVDWESFVGYSGMTWEQIADTRPTEPVLVRARARVSSYYNFGFTEDDWACVELEDATGNHLLYGYARLDGAVLDQLRRALPSTSGHLTVKIAYPEASKAKNQVLITEVVGQGWIQRGAPQAAVGKVFRYQVPASDRTIEFKLPAGKITAMLLVSDVPEALALVRRERWVPERGLRLYFGRSPQNPQLPTAADPRFVGIWDPQPEPRLLRVGDEAYEISLKKGGEDDALLFNVIGRADCRSLPHRATVIGRKMGDAIIADEVHVTPVEE